MSSCRTQRVKVPLSCEIFCLLPGVSFLPFRVPTRYEVSITCSTAVALINPHLYFKTSYVISYCRPLVTPWQVVKHWNLATPCSNAITLWDKICVGKMQTCSDWLVSLATIRTRRNRWVHSLMYRVVDAGEGKVAGKQLPPHHEFRCNLSARGDTNSGMSKFKLNK